MAKKKTKQVEAWKLEVKEINRQVKEHREEIKQLLERKRELNEQHGKKKWDDTTPLFEFVNMTQFERFNEMLKGWEPFLKEKIGINIKKHHYFRFNLSESDNKKEILKFLKKAQEGLVPVFWLNDKPMSMRQLFLYFERHSNLGSAEGIKSALRERGVQKSGVKCLK